MNSVLVPRLEIIPFDDSEHVAPNDAEGPVETWAGNGGDAYGYSGGGREWIYLPGVATFAFSSSPTTVYAMPTSGSRSPVIEDAYRRNILPLVLQMSGIEVLHASAVASAEGAIAICGVSGAGKSTLAHHLGDRGYPPIADDAVAWHLTDKRATVLRIPFRLRPEGGMPQIESTRRQQPPLEPSILDHDVPLHAIMVLQKAESGARAFRMKHIVSGSAFQALLPHAYAYRLDNETRMGRMLGDYMDLASAVPVFDARLRHDPAVLASALDQIENRVIACEHPAR